MRISEPFIRHPVATNAADGCDGSGRYCSVFHFAGFAIARSRFPNHFSKRKFAGSFARDNGIVRGFSP